MNPYQILGITPSTSYEDAKRIFRKRMKELHPDMGGDPKEMQKVKEAWDCLNSEKDTLLGQASSRVRHQSLFEIKDI